MVTPGVEIGRDRYNKPIFADVAIEVTDVAVAPGATSVDETTGQVIDTRGLTLYLPPTVKVAPTARFIVRGKTYPIDGASQDWDRPVGFSRLYDSWAPGNVVNLSSEEYANA
ncbi:hypothetical protein [Curtobacterium sp. MCSS17_015]|uniref:hypothetical protein n=1 Tax=Curtobacterium sp. MCSS17_015 TaxID=2175666 RepID=UPI0015E8DB68|nr:hypothetical protein [Curtobacterium sp. MCSS17_015]WIB25816.1 hypothetical protein DEJ18_12270 [Curtobacterium sp. MCSS17_015]